MFFYILALPPSPPNTSSEGSISDHDEEYRLQAQYAQQHRLLTPLSPYGLAEPSSPAVLSPQFHLATHRGNIPVIKSSLETNSHRHIHPSLLQHQRYIKLTNGSIPGTQLEAGTVLPISPLQRRLASVHVSTNALPYGHHQQHGITMTTPPSTPPEKSRKGTFISIPLSSYNKLLGYIVN